MPRSQGQLQPVEQASFQITIHATGEKAPSYTVKNLTGRAITAWVLEISSTAGNKRKSTTVWDSLLKAKQPIEPGESMSQYLPHMTGEPLPAKIEVVAGIWADGETFGQPEWVKNIRENRERRISEYERAMRLLQQGLDEDWSRDQDLKTISKDANSGPFTAIQFMLTRTDEYKDNPQLLHKAVQGLLEAFKESAEQIRKAMNAADVAAGP
jgi:hypothetical protein